MTIHFVMRHAALLKFIGPAFIIAGLLIRYKISRNRFNRRTVTGLQRFSTYNKALFTRISESFAISVGNVFLFVGIIITLGQLL